MNLSVVINKVSKSFSITGNKFSVLENIEFEVNRGEIIAIIGKSGCGKTTLLRLISGLEKPDQGEIYIDSAIVSKPSKSAIMIFQEFNQIFPWKTVLWNVASPLMITKMTGSRKTALHLADSIIKEVGLCDFKNFYPSKLSGGMKQRVAIARALALQPSVLLLDEAFSALDGYNKRQLHCLTKRIVEQHRVSVICVTHSIREALSFADRIIVLSSSPAKVVNIINNRNNDINTKNKLAYEVGEFIYTDSTE